MSELRDAYKAIKLLKDALEKSKEELSHYKKEMRIQEDQHLVDLQTLQDELNRLKSNQQPSPCQHHGQGIEALQRQYSNELKKLRDEVEYANTVRQQKEEELAEATTALQVQKQIHAVLLLEKHSLQANLTKREEESYEQKIILDKIQQRLSVSQLETHSLKDIQDALQQQVNDHVSIISLLNEQHDMDKQRLLTSISQFENIVMAKEAQIEQLDARNHEIEQNHANKFANALDKISELEKVQKELQLRDLTDSECQTVNEDVDHSRRKAAINEKVLEWQSTVKSLAIDLQPIKNHVKEMNSYGREAFMQTSHRTQSQEASMRNLEISVVQVRKEHQSLKDSWHSISTDTMEWMKNIMGTIQGEIHQEIDRLVALQTHSLSERIHSIQQEWKLTASDCKSLLRETQTQFTSDLKLVNENIVIAIRRTESSECVLMALEDKRSIRTSPPHATWNELGTTTRQLKLPAHKLSQLFEQANYLLKLLNRNVDTLKTLESTQIHDSLLAFVSHIDKLLKVLPPDELAKDLEKYTASIHEALYSWQTCDTTYLDGIPVPSFGIESPEVNHIIATWTTNSNMKSAATRWLSAVFLNQPTNELTFRFENLTREVKDAILVLIVPLLKSKRPIKVHLKRQATTNDRWDLAIEIESSQSPKQSSPQQSAMFKAIQRRLSELQK